MAMDRYIYLWQIAANGNEYMGANHYKPFPTAANCGAKLKSCGVSYGSSKTGSNNKKKSNNLKSSRLMSDDEVALELFGSVSDASGDDPMTPQAMSYLTEALAELPHNDDTYEWSAVFNRLDPSALKDRTFSLHVFLNSDGQLGQLPHEANGRIDVTELHLRPDYCGSYGGFVTWMGDMPGHVHKVSVTLKHSRRHPKWSLNVLQTEDGCGAQTC